MACAGATESRPTSGVFARVDVPKPPPSRIRRRRCARQLTDGVAELSALVERTDRNALLARLAVRAVDQIRQQEQPEGLYDTIARMAPRLVPRIEQLVTENDRIQLLARTLHHYARADAPQAMVHMSLERLNAALRAQAEANSALVQEALLTDLGEAG